jgi:hypothetical protein
VPTFTTFKAIFFRQGSARVAHGPIFVFRTSQLFHSTRIGHTLTGSRRWIGPLGGPGPVYVKESLVGSGSLRGGCRASRSWSEEEEGEDELRELALAIKLASTSKTSSTSPLPPGGGGLQRHFPQRTRFFRYTGPLVRRTAAL